jgi:hypothetical protein
MDRHDAVGSGVGADPNLTHIAVVKTQNLSTNFIGGQRLHYLQAVLEFAQSLR